MIPSDHFVRFYNEVFKFLDSKGGLEKYYDEISCHQDFHCHALFREKGLQGILEYYEKIRKEENCELEIRLNGHEIALPMKKCPSLTKAMDNDAGVCPKYCLHCPGWTKGVYQRAGLYLVYDLMGLDNPQCCGYVYDDLDCAKAKYDELLKVRPVDQIIKNF